uniref:Uncharacterized protein n=1 Tax=Oryza rufipogon TaxID=4529 RepID=A0A0E0QE95_ORYRU
MAWVDRGTGHGVANRGQGRDGREDVVLQSNHYAGHHAVINSAPSQPGVDAPPLPSPSRLKFIILLTHLGKTLLSLYNSLMLLSGLIEGDLKRCCIVT